MLTLSLRVLPPALPFPAGSPGRPAQGGSPAWESGGLCLAPAPASCAMAARGAVWAQQAVGSLRAVFVIYWEVETHTQMQLSG